MLNLRTWVREITFPGWIKGASGAVHPHGGGPHASAAAGVAPQTQRTSRSGTVHLTQVWVAPPETHVAPLGAGTGPTSVRLI